MRQFTVYMHINKLNGKIYVGMTSQPLSRRFRRGEGYRKNIYFYRAICKIGWDNFEHRIIAQNLSQLKAEELEKSLISKYQTTDPSHGYNITDGGDGLNGYIPTLALKKLRSLQNAGERNPFYGKHHTPETRAKLSAINKTKMAGTENPFYGKKHNEQTKEKIRQYRLGKTMPQEVRQRISLSTTGAKNHFYGMSHSVEQRKKWSQKRTGAGNPMARAVDQYDLSGNYLKTYSTAKEAGDILGIENTNITRCCKKERKTAGNFIWRYHEECHI
ncbi:MULTISPECIES: NUMOD3 domain-containing DNA-binding protein [Anaerotruncus]|uniref:NUMOD3 domain-containing DNA-binding protein n=1 Tax=Anaerotruncus TaxID=244127 RepID=UPI0013147FEC|nr:MULTISPECIES: NUMOD3 domain-containing DNA-binding protein [Anaerotruncus]